MRWMKNLVKILANFFKQLTICQILTTTKGILLLQPNWIYLYQLLDLSPYDAEGVFHQNRYKKVKKEIEPAYVISPAFMQCQTQSCKGQSLHINTRDDAPRATLIK